MRCKHLSDDWKKVEIDTQVWSRGMANRWFEQLGKAPSLAAPHEFERSDIVDVKYLRSLSHEGPIPIACMRCP